MVTGKHGARRDEVCSAARALVQEELELFEAAGQQLDEIYSEELVREDDDFPLGPGEKYAAEETPEGTRLKRLGVAAKCFRFPESHPYDNHFDFEGIGPIEDRKLAARMGILVMLAAGDPDKGEVITPAMGVLANTPYAIKSEDRLPGIGGSQWLFWNETGWDDYKEPSPRVLKRLRDAIDIVRHGSLDAARKSRIPSGDGRPCDQPGLNPYDELDRSLRDLLRHVDVFDGNASQWLETHQYDFGQKRDEQRDWLLDYTRQWWRTWEPAVKRLRNALSNVQRPELKDLNTEGLMALGKLNRIFSAPIMYMAHEEPGDHLLVRPLSVLGFQREDDRFLVSNYPSEQVSEAVRPIQRFLEALALFLEQEVDENDIAFPESIVEPKAKPKREMINKPMRYETATVKALAIARAEGWPRRSGKPSVRRMAQKVGCSPHTLSKALENSKELRHHRDRDIVALPTNVSELAGLILDQQKDAKSDRI